ncbi:hypothetical protein SAMN06297129_1286 [Pseudooceanicola antarcticus]|uniref:Uncharacterized protein n=2 Tax=Pseudooceanicola antarcticus TaxID=1247613 RepID=A0A285ILV3_9RHOB|nr:hypothetical protein CVM39_10405 [Pseudooceanicola antarcticus]SNY47951.1 hypothetical protein SAMN06297129_1286 [Pseudooceanicola antarcticus]
MTETLEAWQGDLYELSLGELLALQGMSLADKQARREELARVVPTRDYGDGTDTYEDFIEPQHATGPEQAAAAKELFWIRSDLGEIERLYPNAESDLFVIAVIRARVYLREVGIDYRGDQKTVVFWSEQRGRHVQVDLDLYQRLILKGEREIGYRFGRLLRFEPNDPNRDLPRADHTSISREQKAQAEAWLQKYPWRNGCRRLAALFSQGEIESNTPFWHAVAVLTHHETFARGLKASARDAENGGLTAEEAEEALKEASEVSFAAGLSAAAFVRKPLEYDVMAMRKAKLKRAEASGKASNSKRAARVAAFWTEIEALAPLYPQISEDRLVDQAFEHAVAKDPDLWRQGRGQKEAYLSEDIRSKEPYKSRYYALFSKTA